MSASDSKHRYGFIRWNDYNLLYQMGGCVRWGIVYRKSVTEQWSVIPLDPLSAEVDCSTVKSLSSIVTGSEYTLCPVNKSHEGTFALLMSSLPTIELDEYMIQDITRCQRTLPTKGGLDGDFIGSSLILSLLSGLGDVNASILDGLPVSDMLDPSVTIKLTAPTSNTTVNKDPTSGKTDVKMKLEAKYIQWLTSTFDIIMPVTTVTTEAAEVSDITV